MNYRRNRGCDKRFRIEVLQTCRMCLFWLFGVHVIEDSFEFTIVFILSYRTEFDALKRVAVVKCVYIFLTFKPIAALVDRFAFSAIRRCLVTRQWFTIAVLQFDFAHKFFYVHCVVGRCRKVALNRIWLTTKTGKLYIVSWHFYNLSALSVKFS